jgi:hypothetical protein
VDGLPLRINELILIQGLFTSKIGNERRLPKQQAGIFAPIPLLKRIRFLAPWYLCDYSMFVGFGVYKVVDMLYVNAMYFFMIIYEFWFSSHDFTNST